MPEQTISKRDNTWLFQVCKHLISCILQCAIGDHLGHICCKVKHFKVQATLCSKTQEAQQGGTTVLQQRSLDLRLACSIYNKKTVYCTIRRTDDYAQPLSGCPCELLHSKKMTFKGIRFQQMIGIKRLCSDIEISICNLILKTNLREK